MKKNLFIPALIFSLGFSGNAYPMAWIAANLTKEGLKKAIEKATTGLHWGIAAGPVWRDIATQLIEYEEIKKNIRDGKSYSGSSYRKQELEWVKKHQEWIRQELKSLGYTNWETIDLIPCLQFAVNGDLRTQTLFYDERKVAAAYAEHFTSLNPKKKKCNEVRALLSHEISHLENNDQEIYLGINFTTPFVTHFVSNKIASLANIPVPNFALRNALKILSGIGKSTINMLSPWAYLNFAEKNADENIVNDIEVLEGAAQLFRRYAKYEIFNDKINPSWYERYERFWRLPDTHEDSLKRAQRFEERIAQLKNSQVSQKAAFSEQKVSHVNNQNKNKLL